MIEDLRAEPSAADLTGWNARGGNQPGSESGSDALGARLRRAAPRRAGSVRFEGNPRQTTARTTRSSFLRAVEEARLSTTLLQSMYVYYPSSPFARSPRRSLLGPTLFRSCFAINSRRFEVFRAYSSIDFEILL